jgi:hypothetical protein
VIGACFDELINLQIHIDGCETMNQFKIPMNEKQHQVTSTQMLNHGGSFIVRTLLWLAIVVVCVERRPWQSSKTCSLQTTLKNNQRIRTNEKNKK